MPVERDNTALFRKGLEILCAGFGRELSKPMMDAYHGTLAATLTDDEWRAGVRRALAEEERLPPPAWFLRERRAAVERAVTSEAVMIFEQIADGRCTVGEPPNRWISVNSVRRRLGQQAAEAFVVAGGEAAFLNARPQDLPFVQHRFMAAYRGLALTRGTALALLAPQTAKGELSDGAAGRGRDSLEAGGGRATPEDQGPRG